MAVYTYMVIFSPLSFTASRPTHEDANHKMSFMVAPLWSQPRLQCMRKAALIMFFNILTHSKYFTIEVTADFSAIVLQFKDSLLRLIDRLCVKLFLRLQLFFSFFLTHTASTECISFSSVSLHYIFKFNSFFLPFFFSK